MTTARLPVILSTVTETKGATVKEIEMSSDEKTIGGVFTIIEFWVMSLVGIVIGTLMLPMAMIGQLFTVETDYHR